jgi:hypothetical protein
MASLNAKEAGKLSPCLGSVFSATILRCGEEEYNPLVGSYVPLT